MQNDGIPITWIKSCWHLQFVTSLCLLLILPRSGVRFSLNFFKLNLRKPHHELYGKIKNNLMYIARINHHSIILNHKKNILSVLNRSVSYYYKNCPCSVYFFRIIYLFIWKISTTIKKILPYVSYLIFASVFEVGA